MRIQVVHWGEKFQHSFHLLLQPYSPPERSWLRAHGIQFWRTFTPIPSPFRNDISIHCTIYGLFHSQLSTLDDFHNEKSNGCSNNIQLTFIACKERMHTYVRSLVQLSNQRRYLESINGFVHSIFKQKDVSLLKIVVAESPPISVSFDF